MIAIRDLDALREGAQVVPTVAATYPHALSGGCGKGLHHGGRNRLVPHACQRRRGAFRLGLGVIPDRLQAGDALRQGGVVRICHAAFDSVV